MNALMRTVSLVLIVIMVGSGCAATEGPKPPKQSWTVPQSEVNAMGDCKSRYPKVNGIWDPLTGYFAFTGADAENNRRCLIENYGWFELGPPEFTKGTMSPPRKLWP